MKTSIIIPTMGRPDANQVPNCVSRCVETVKGHDAEVIVVVEVHEPTAQSLLGLGAKILFRPEHKGAAAGWNEGAWHATGDLFVLGSDDVSWCDGWLDALLPWVDKLPERCGVIGLNDCHRTDGWAFATHYAVTRSYCVQHLSGVFVVPVYKHFNCDLEIGFRARREGRYLYAQDARLDHHHYLYDSTVYDSVYDSVRGYYEEDTQLLEVRKAHGFPNDWLPILGVPMAELEARG